MAMAKAEVRQRLVDRRRHRSAEDLLTARRAVCAAALDGCARRDARCVAGYVPLRTEPGSAELLDGLASAGRRVLVPITLPDRDLDWQEWQAGEAGGDALGREAIAAADVAFVPALAVSYDGVRLGRGGGSYDRSLPRARPGCEVVALLFDDELLDALPADEWDVRVSAVVTPGGGWRPLG